MCWPKSNWLELMKRQNKQYSGRSITAGRRRGGERPISFGSFMSGMKNRHILYLAAFSAAAVLFTAQSVSQIPAAKTARLLELSGPIGPAASDYFSKGLEKARSERAGIVILRIDTPGGLASSMRDIIKDILASPIPVVSYVAPSGARAASAGTYIMYAAHVAAMAPGTNLGAATPVQVGGGSPFPVPGSPDKGDKGDKGADKDSAKPSASMQDKIVNDSVAYIRSLAQLRGRNADWAEKAVREAASLASEDALKKKVIDLIAEDLDELLAKVNGRTTKVLGVSQTLDTAGMKVDIFEPDWRTKLLGIITNPNVAYVLMLIGIYGLILEFYSPGTMVPGTIGAISLLLALYAFNLLPINYAGLALILLGIALITAEAFMPSFGILGLGGVASLVIGSIMLIETDLPGFQISRFLIGSIAALSAGAFALMLLFLIRARRKPVVSGVEHLLGNEGRVIEWDGLNGRVRIQGEIWSARAEAPLKHDSRVRVDRIEGLQLVVRPKS